MVHGICGMLKIDPLVVVTPKPAANDDVLITFASTTDTTGVFYGKTPANQISPSSYFISPTRVDLHAG